VALPAASLLPILCGAILLAAIALAIRAFLRNRPSPQEIERRRRLAINSVGKLIAGQIVDLNGSMVNYSYMIAGVEYSASQDISGLESILAGDPMRMLGAVGVKFDPRNPANSIIICEEWTGIGRSRF
jgi:hypothetical protein